jgi:hypothetical protein
VVRACSSALRKLKQEDQKFETCLGYIEKPDFEKMFLKDIFSNQNFAGKLPSFSVLSLSQQVILLLK